MLGFSKASRAYLVYLGSTLWMAALISVDAVLLPTARDDATVALTIACNAVAFVAQTVDVLCFHFRAWPLTSINWTGQLGALGLVSARVALRDPHARLRLLAQALFTASQFAVTLEYLARAAATPPPFPVASRAPRWRNRA